MKIITDFVPAPTASKYDDDAAALVEAFKSNPEVIGAIEVDVLGATDDADRDKIISRETRAFQAAALKLGYSARSKATRDNGDGSFDVLFAVSTHKARKPKPAAEEVAVETAPVETAPVESAHPAGKSRK